MAEQNYKNHIRLVPLHLAGYVLAGAILGMSLVKLWRSYSTGLTGLLVPAILVLNALVLVIVLWYCRWFALRAQDKAIRAEENLRYFAITGKLLDSKLRMSQIVALRFAPNNEFVDLAHRAAEENLTSKQIKEAIKHWKEDNNRV
jgi:cbb3-type cytochrome oxidase subunit 3